MIKLKSFSVSAINRALQSMWCKICNITGRVETLEIGVGLANNFANDAAAAVGGIAVGSVYHTAGTVKIRLS